MKQFEGIFDSTISSSSPFLGIVVQLTYCILHGVGVSDFTNILVSSPPTLSSNIGGPSTRLFLALRARLLPYGTTPIHPAWFVWPLAQ